LTNLPISQFHFSGDATTVQLDGGKVHEVDSELNECFLMLFRLLRANNSILLWPITIKVYIAVDTFFFQNLTALRSDVDFQIADRQKVDFIWSWQSGVDAMITVFYDFRQFSPKKIGAFLKNQYYDQIVS
jgi:hypothetical protein